MTSRKLSVDLKKIGTLAPLVAACTASILLCALGAKANPLVPQQEGELYVGLGACSGSGCSYISPPSIIGSIVSLPDPSTGSRSRLFVDKAGTENNYGTIRFRSQDLITSDASGAYWFRPAAMESDTVTPIQKDGELEVGTFKFNFMEPLTDLTIALFDVEKKGTSYKVQFADGNTESGEVPAGEDSNRFEKTFSNVKSITLTLGKKQRTTGDGVNFMASSSYTPKVVEAPEPVAPMAPPVPRPQPLPAEPPTSVPGLW
jgi:hypothetical protein